MKNLNYLFIILFILLSACTARYVKLEEQASKQYLSGKYQTSFLRSIESLKLNPDYPKSQDIFIKSFNSLVIKKINNISNLEKTSSLNKWDLILTEYESLNEYISQANEALNFLKNKNIYLETIKVDYQEKLKKAKLNSVDYHYQKAKKLSKNKSLKYQKLASIEFKRVLNLFPNYLDAKSLYNKARANGTKIIAILSFKDKTNSNSKYQISLSDLITDEIINKLVNDEKTMEHLSLVSREDLKSVFDEQKLASVGVFKSNLTKLKDSNISGVHEILIGKITSVSHNREKITSKVISKKSKTSLGKRKFFDRNGNEYEKEVFHNDFANFIKYKKQSSLNITVSYKIIDIKTAKIIYSNSLQRLESFEDYWGDFQNGNRDLLNYEEELLVNNYEQITPTPEKLLQKAIASISNSIYYDLKNHYK